MLQPARVSFVHPAGVGALAFLLLSPGCAYNHTNRDIDRSPVVDTGVGATILRPGQTVPMPTRAWGPGSPYGTPGVATPESAARAPAPGGVTWIGGAQLDEERHIEIREEPRWLKALLFPFALVAAPFQYVAGALRGPEPVAAPTAPITPAPASARTARPAPIDYETERLNAMERELASRTRAAAATPPPTTQAPPTSFQSESSSIADELAALRETRAGAGAHASPGREVAASPRAPGSAEFVGRNLTAAHGTVDRNGDGRPDHWIFRNNGEIERELFDEDGNGQPDRHIHYDRDTHAISRIDEDADRDGVLDEWTEYRGGVLVRRRADADRDGTADTWAYYEGGEIQRHERDSTGDGFRDRVAFYQDGRVVREEQDRTGDGQVDVTTHFDDQERVAKKSEDTDGDGRVDLVSHFEKGRLVSRQILDPDRVSAAPESH